MCSGDTLIQVTDIAVPVEQQNRLAGLHAALHNAAAQSVGGFVRDAGFAGANAEQCLLRDALEPVVLHDLVNGVIVHKNGQGIEHLLRL